MTVVDTPGTLNREVPARRAPRLTAGELEKQMAAERKDREAALLEAIRRGLDRPRGGCDC